MLGSAGAASLLAGLPTPSGRASTRRSRREPLRDRAVERVVLLGDGEVAHEATGPALPRETERRIPLRRTDVGAVAVHGHASASVHRGGPVLPADLHVRHLDILLARRVVHAGSMRRTA